MVILNAVKRLVAYAASLSAQLVQCKIDLAIALQLPVASAEEIAAAQAAVIESKAKADALQALVDEDLAEDAEVLTAIGEILPDEPPVL